MQSRYLRRHIEKYLSLDDASDVEVVLNWLRQQRALENNSTPVVSFIEGFEPFLRALERSFAEFDRVVKSRETSLDIAETELTTLNRQLTEEAELRSRVLLRLQDIVAALNAGVNDGAPVTIGAELDLLISNVEALAKSHKNRSEDIELIFAESLRLSNSRSWRELAANLAASARALLEGRADVIAYGSLVLLKRGTDDGYKTLHHIDGKQTFTKADLESSCTWLHPIALSARETPQLLLQVFMPAFGNALKDRFTQLMGALAPAIFSTCELIQYVSDIQRRSQLEAEINTARLVQQTLMPSRRIDVAGALEVRAFFSTATECGGDWWSCAPLPDGRHLVLLGDVSGHGTGSALVTALAKGFCDSAARQKPFDAVELFTGLDTLLAGISEGAQRAMSLVAALFDPVRGTCEVWNAGHPPLYWAALDAAGGRKVGALAVPSELLGAGRDAGVDPLFGHYVRHYGPGDLFVLYSDGLIEACSPDGLPFGAGRLPRILRALSAQVSADHVLDAVRNAFETFMAGAIPDDDVTLVVIKAQGLSA